MKIALISDTHGVVLPEIPDEAEVVIHAGDVCPDTYKGGRYQLAWLNEVFGPWAAALAPREIHMTWGNHDFIGERLPVGTILDELPDNVFIHVDNAVEIGGKRVWFSPWSPLFGGWAFMQTEEGLAERYALIPKDTQIIVSHSPPRGYGDLINGSWFPDGQPAHVGSTALLERCGQLEELELLVCGHIHDGRGIHSVTRDAAHGQVIHLFDVVNAACVDETYKPVPNGPIVVDI